MDGVTRALDPRSFAWLAIAAQLKIFVEVSPLGYILLITIHGLFNVHDFHHGRLQALLVLSGLTQFGVDITIYFIAIGCYPV